MKNWLLVLFFILFLSTQILAGGQKISAIAESSDWLGLEWTYRELNLKTNNIESSVSSLMLGFFYKDISESFGHSEHIGYINWEGENDDFGLYFNFNAFFRYTFNIIDESQQIFIALGAISGFEYGLFGDDKYLFFEAGLCLSVGYQMPKTGFSLYLSGFYEHIFLSKVADIELEYVANPPWALSFGIEYTPSETIFNFGIELTFFRETTFVAFFAIDI